RVLRLADRNRADLAARALRLGRDAPERGCASRGASGVRKLTVVVLNWNGLADTRSLLPTLLACRMPEDWTLEPIVVDNGSTDGSVAALRAEFTGVQVLDLPQNRRFAGGNNAGLSRALANGADAVALLNNDTKADPGLFERLLLALEQDPGAGA